MSDRALTPSQRLAASTAADAPGHQSVRGKVQGLAANIAALRPGVAALVVAYTAYMMAAAFGRWLMVMPGISITVWPPNGVILALLLTQPRRSWPWWILIGVAGELTGNAIWFQNPPLWALGYIAANAAATTAAAFLLAPHLQAPIRRIATLPQVLAFLGIGVLAAPVVSATLGSVVDALVGRNLFVTTWPLWWLGDATGILIATPLVMSTLNAWRERARPTLAQILEGAAIALVLAGISAWQLTTGAVHAFLLLLPVLWAALRYEIRGAAFAVLGLAVATGIHAQGIDPTEGLTAAAALLHVKMQALILVAASTGLIVAAVIRQQRQAVEELASANNELEARVAERTRAIEVAEQRFKATFQNAGVGIGIIGADSVLLRINERLAEMLGYEVGDMEGHQLDQFTHPDDLSLGEAAWNRLKSGEGDEYELEKRYIRKDGSTVWGNTTVSCVREPGGRIDYLIEIIQDITARKRSDEARRLLMLEINHRSKNLLTIVQVIARQMAARSPQDFVKIFNERLRSLAANQDLLVQSGWQNIDLTELVCAQLEHFSPVGSRVTMSGPAVMVPPAAAQALSMALHELATNAVKYGSLSNETGLVEIAWAVSADTFSMSWRERGGPEVAVPKTAGFGSVVLDKMTASSMLGEVTINYAPEGIVWQLRCPLSVIQQQPAKLDPE